MKPMAWTAVAVPQLYVCKDSTRNKLRPQVGRDILAPVRVGLRALLQRFPVPDEPFPAVIRHLEILGQLQRVHRTRVLAKSAEHAAAQVVGKLGELLAARFFV